MGAQNPQSLSFPISSSFPDPLWPSVQPAGNHRDEVCVHPEDHRFSSPPCSPVKAPVKQNTAKAQLVPPHRTRAFGAVPPTPAALRKQNFSVRQVLWPQCSSPTLEPASPGVEIRGLPPLRCSGPQLPGLFFLPLHTTVENDMEEVSSEADKADQAPKSQAVHIHR